MRFKLPKIITSYLVCILVVGTAACSRTNNENSQSQLSSRQPVNSEREAINDSSEQSLIGSSIVSSIKHSSSSIKSSGSSSKNSSSKSSSTPTQSIGTYPPLGNDVMPIGAWIAPPHAKTYGNSPNFITDEQFKLLGESGINIIIPLYENYQRNKADVMKSLDLCQKYGVKYIVKDNNITEPDRDIMSDSIKDYMYHPAFVGNFIQDEPGIVSFERFGEAFKVYNELLPSKYFYINLLPTGAEGTQLYGGAACLTGPTTTPTAYINSYVNNVKPKYISYDFYPLIGSFPSIEPHYFTDMSTYRAAAKRANVPFWVFVQTCTTLSISREPKEAEIYWQVNTALSYGAKGIQYYCYFTPLEYPSSGRENFINQSGKKTPIYNFGQNMNRQIKAVDEVLMNSTHKGVIVTGTSPAPIPQMDQITTYGVLSGVTSRGAPSLTGCFDYKGKNAYYVVNNSINQSAAVTLNFTKSVSGSKYINASKTTFSGSSLTITLAAGTGALVEIN